MKNVYCIGGGGVGSWLTPAMCLLLGDPSKVIVVDGDMLEKKNLNRQLFTEKDIGVYKSVALAEKYNCQSVNRYFASGMLEIDRGDWIMCAVDNNLGRKEVLATCDSTGCRAVFGGNETLSSEAYYYQASWKRSELDPRTYYPEINTNKSNDPRAAAIGCVEEIQGGNTQRVSANIAACSHMLHLYSVWAIESAKLNREAKEFLPHRIIQNMSSIKMISKAKP
jgi:molybdopterin/thiamine biosynthesis adenylyltransferase